MTRVLFLQFRFLHWTVDSSFNPNHCIGLGSNMLPPAAMTNEFSSANVGVEEEEEEEEEEDEKEISLFRRLG